MNTKRHGSYAVAGIDVASGLWVRLIGSGVYGGVTDADQTLEDGSQPSLFDVLEVPLKDVVREHGHKDAWRIDATAWRRSGQIEGSRRRAFVERFTMEEPVFGTNEPSFSLWSLIESRPAPSIAVIRPQHLIWIKAIRDGRTTFVATFEHAGARQQLPIVDRSWLGRFVDAEMGQYPANNHNDTFLVIISEPLGDECWKLIAAVLQLGDVGS
jgi:hypothetical protein